MRQGSGARSGDDPCHRRGRLRRTTTQVLGRVVELPAPLQQLDSESLARVLEVEIPGEGRFTVARANVEITAAS
ncbi:MAG: hypothetical protein ACE5G2_03160 [Candidatus Krumholzibacteriia bacterium]